MLQNLSRSRPPCTYYPYYIKKRAKKQAAYTAFVVFSHEKFLSDLFSEKHGGV
jgi:hypothetical protein